jgi:predicted transcriptional regulator
MKVKDIVNELELKVVAGEEELHNEIKNGFIGDLLSVVMGKAEEGCAWITIQSHINIVAVATLVSVACIIVTEGFEVEEIAIQKANEEGIPVLTSKKSSYEIAKKLGELGI